MSDGGGERTASILLVDDQPENLIALEAVLEPLGQRLVKAQSGDEALKLLLREDFALILLDVQMPGLDGFQTAAYVKRRERTRHIPIIFLTAISKELHHVFRGYSAGAVDYVLKPFDPAILRSKVQVFVDLWRKEAALRESEERFRTAFADAPIGVALVSPEGRMLQVNRALGTMLGYAEGELVGRMLAELSHPADSGDELSRLLAGEARSHRREQRHVGRDGREIWTLVNVSLVRDDVGRPLHFIVQIEDVSERKQAELEREAREREERARAEAEAVAETVAKLQAVSDVALAHLTLGDLLKQLLPRLRETLEVEHAGILLVSGHDEAGGLALGASIGPEDGVHVAERIPVSTDAGGRIAGLAGAAKLDDVADEDVVHPLLRHLGLRSLLAAPLTVDGRLHGVMQLARAARASFTDEDVTLLELMAGRVALAIEHARLYEREHGLVETFQRTLLPARLPQLPGVKVAARYLPGGPGADVGGDWYDVIPLEDGGVGLAMGDVAGHGIRAATVMGQLRSSLRAYALEGHPPNVVIEQLHRLVRELEPGWMATLLYAVLDPEAETLRYANAGHPPALLVSPGRRTRYLERGRGAPLGAGARASYEEVSERLRSGSTLVLYTDGLIEKRGGSLDAGLARLARVSRVRPAGPAELCEAIQANLVGAGVPVDDIAFLVVETVPLTGERLVLQFSADPKALGAIRRALGGWLRNVGAEEDAIGAIQLACHEACTNAIEHAYRFAEAVLEVEATVDDGTAILVVRDSGGWRGVGSIDRGRGLQLMETLMDEVEVRPRTDGTTVTMRKRIAAAPEPAVQAPRPRRRRAS